MVRAGLLDRLIDAHRDLMLKVYEEHFHWDMNNEESKAEVYRRMGSMVGMMLYLYGR